MRITTLAAVGFQMLAAMLIVALLLAHPARAGVLDDAVVALTVGGWSWVTVPLLTCGFAGLAWLGRQASVLLAERAHASRVARLMNTLASVAAGIARTMLEHPPAAADVLAAVRQAAIAQGVAYAKASMPGTIKAVGIDDDRLAARLANEVSAAELASPRQPLAAMVVRGLTALADDLAAEVPAGAAAV